MTFSRTAKELAVGVPISMAFGFITAAGTQNFEQNLYFNTLAAWTAVVILQALWKYDFNYSLSKSEKHKKCGGVNE